MMGLVLVVVVMVMATRAQMLRKQLLLQVAVVAARFNVGIESLLFTWDLNRVGVVPKKTRLGCNVFIYI